MRPIQRGYTAEAEAHLRYRAEGGTACPVCRSRRLTSDTSLHADRPSLVFYLNRRCIECGAEWIESFSLMGIDLLYLPQSLHADKDE